MYGIVYFTD